MITVNRRTKLLLLIYLHNLDIGRVVDSRRIVITRGNYVAIRTVGACSFPIDCRGRFGASREMGLGFFERSREGLGTLFYRSLHR